MYLRCDPHPLFSVKNIPVRKIKPVEPDAPAAEGFSIRRLQDLLNGEALTHELHRHDFYFVLAVEQGSGQHQVDFTPHEVKDHSVFVLRPGQVHQLNLRAGSTGFIMEFSPAFYEPKDLPSAQILNRVSSKNECELDPSKVTKLYSILETILEEHQQKQDSYKEVIRAELGIFFIELLRHRKTMTASTPATGTYEQEQLDKLLRLIDSHLAAHKQVSYYADQLNLSAYQLNSITKSLLGKTCSDLIAEQIILEAKRYLLATSNQVTQIAYHLGYDDVSYFIRFFKKHTGHTPDVFRTTFKA